MLYSRRVVSPASSDSGGSTLSDLEGRRSARESRVRPWLVNAQRVPSGKATGSGMPPAKVAKPTVTTASAPAAPRSSIPTRPGARLAVASKPASGLPVARVAVGVVREKKQSSRAPAACDGAALVSRLPVPSQASKVGRVGTGAGTGSQPPTSTPRRLGAGTTKPGTLISPGVASARPPMPRHGIHKAGPGDRPRELPPARLPAAGKVQAPRSGASAQAPPRAAHEGKARTFEKVPPQRARLASSVPAVVSHAHFLPSAVPGKTALKKAKVTSADNKGTGPKAAAVVEPRVKHVAFSTKRPQLHIVSRWQVPLEKRPQSCGCVDRCDNRSAACAGDRVATVAKAKWLLNQMQMQVEVLKLSAASKAKE